MPGEVADGDEVAIKTEAAAKPSPTSPTAVGPNGSKKVAWSSDCLKAGVTWEWQHKTGWKAYPDRAIDRIEHAFQDGKSHILIKAGKTGSTPKELFFMDHVQYDPITGNTRPIRRLGPDHMFAKLRREWLSFLHYLQTGETQKMSFSKFKDNQKSAPNLRQQAEESQDKTPWLKSHKDSNLAWIARSGWFAMLSGLGIALNMVWLGIDAEMEGNHEKEKNIAFIVVDSAFCLFFLAEVIINVGAHKICLSAFMNMWVLLDVVMAVLYIGEVWVQGVYIAISDADPDRTMKNFALLRSIRFLRLARLGRIVRLLRVVPGALAVFKGFIRAVQAVWFTFAMLAFVTYIFAVMLRMQTAGEKTEEIFPGISSAMWKLILNGAFLDDVTGIMNDMVEESYLVTTTFSVYIIVANMTLLNILVGLMADVVANVSQEDQDDQMASELKLGVEDILACHDQENDQHLYEDEFDVMMDNPSLTAVLKSHDIDVKLLKSLKGLLYREKGRFIDEDGNEIPEKEEFGYLVESSDEDAAEGEQKTLTRVPTLGRAITKKAVREDRAISFATFTETVLKLRSSNAASVKDVIELRNFIAEEEKKAEQKRLSIVQHLAGGPRMAAQGDTAPTFVDGVTPDWALEMKEAIQQLQGGMQQLQGDMRAVRREMAVLGTPVTDATTDGVV